MSTRPKYATLLQHQKMYHDATKVKIGIQRLYMMTLTAWAPNDALLKIPHTKANGDFFVIIQRDWKMFFPKLPVPFDIAKDVSIAIRNYLRMEGMYNKYHTRGLCVNIYSQAALAVHVDVVLMETCRVWELIRKANLAAAHHWIAAIRRLMDDDPLEAERFAFSGPEGKP